MKSLKTLNSRGRSNNRPVATGVHCPHSGWWSPEPAPGSRPSYIGQGSIMPAVDGHTVLWRLIKADPAGAYARDFSLMSVPRHDLPHIAAGAFWPDCLD
ncbi:hypothetical protein ARGLB_037_01420 [Arthrobacter globiformis NBRC 12137]|uniref:Uncharacterized protein n=1 Tax=Arthrobacter globiformis (strain ATCC 8010 / DSM 20124 / JCM 1332 / NBRC 12137 / NCIMB 8907 / NRRL B-2979 / 168) TaxID=1077972 RepID=H0QK51_ARTG1|nr:hypothetical protein ARGLB_037_01420 [Arthrobacter globiformis NBRC 12137]